MTKPGDWSEWQAEDKVTKQVLSVNAAILANAEIDWMLMKWKIDKNCDCIYVNVLIKKLDVLFPIYLELRKMNLWSCGVQ